MNQTSVAKEVCQIAVEAGKLVLEVYYDGSTLNVEHKSDESPLTLADRRSNELICSRLADMSDPLPIISEENKAVPYEERRHYPYYWLVDPLDGTKEFIKRNGEFTVNIALIQSDRPVMGVVYTPVTNELFWAVKGQGAFREKAGKVVPIAAGTFNMDDPGLRIVCSRSHLNAETEAFVGQLNAPQLVAKGSSLKFLILATGEAEVYPRLAPTMEWDTAAAQIILEEAGGQVLEYQTQQPLRYNKTVLRNPPFVAYGKVVRSHHHL